MRISDWSSDVCSSDLDERQEQCVGVDFLYQPADAAVDLGMGDLIQPGSRKIEEMAAGNAKEIMGGARLLLHPADMGGIEPGRLSACDDGDMDLDPGRAKPGDRAAAAQYLVVGRSEEHTSELQSLMRL